MKQGIDISFAQAGFDFNAAINNGKSFCIVKLGEHDYIDSAFADNINGALDAGMDAGVYFVPRSTDIDDIKKEAQFFADSIKENITAALNCGIWLDIEECYYQGKVDKQTLTDLVMTFINTVDAAGYDCGLYASYNMLTNYMDVSQLPDYVQFWEANYGTKTCAFKDEHPDKQVSYWQYSDSNGQLDLDIMYEEGE